MSLYRKIPLWFPFFLLIEASPVYTDEVLTYVVRGLDGVVRLTVPVLFHHIPEPGRGADVPHNYVDNVTVIGAILTFIGAVIRA